MNLSTCYERVLEHFSSLVLFYNSIQFEGFGSQIGRILMVKYWSQVGLELKFIYGWERIKFKFFRRNVKRCTEPLKRVNFGLFEAVRAKFRIKIELNFFNFFSKLEDNMARCSLNRVVLSSHWAIYASWTKKNWTRFGRLKAGKVNFRWWDFPAF
jgi:hypothetical protein